MISLREKIWIWGYVLDQIPGGMPYTLSGATYCSLETAADYLGSDNLIYMNSRFNSEKVKSCSSGGAPVPSDFGDLSDKYFQHIGHSGNVICCLQNGNWVESAAKISEFSLTHSNIKGAIFDDFRVPALDETMVSPDKLKEINQALKRHNHEPQLYLVTYSYQDQKELLPYLDHFDVLSFWTWVPSLDYWQREYYFDLMKLKKLTGKPIIQGMYIHDFGIDSAEPVPFDTFQFIVEKTYNLVRAGTLDGCIIPQNGWFCHRKHRKHIQWLKDYTDWFCDTTTCR